MKTDRLIPAVLALFLVFAFLWAVFAPKASVTEEVAKKISEQKKKSDLFMKGATFSEVVGGIKYWEIRSITSQINKDTEKALLNEVNGIFFRDGKPEVNFIAPTVSWDMRSKKITIKSPLGFDDNFKFKTSDLYWSLDSKKISTDSEIFFESEGLYMKAGGFLADTALENMVLKEQPYAEIKGAGGSVRIEADLFEVNGKTGVVSAKGNVEAKRGDLDIKCDELSFNKNKNKIFLNGSVKMTLKDISAVSNSAEYDTNTALVVLSGAARAKRGYNTISGNELKIDTKNNKITVEGQTKIVVEEEIITKEYR